MDFWPAQAKRSIWRPLGLPTSTSAVQEASVTMTNSVKGRSCSLQGWEPPRPPVFASSFLKVTLTRFSTAALVLQITALVISSDWLSETLLHCFKTAAGWVWHGQAWVSSLMVKAEGLALHLLCQDSDDEKEPNLTVFASSDQTSPLAVCFNCLANVRGNR